MNLLDLPIEVVTYTILQLDAKQISLCRAVCRFLKHLIDTTPAILYRVELSISSTADAQNSSLSKSKKYELLRRRNETWLTLQNCRRIDSISVNNYAAVYELASGYFFQDVNRDVDDSNMQMPSRVTWFELPSRSRNGGRIGEWTFSFKVADLCLDVDRDLVIFVERSDRTISLISSINCKLHLRTLTTNEQHPEARQPYLTAQFPVRTPDYTMIVQLSGNHVGILLSTRHWQGDSNDAFFLWDWTTGLIKGELHSKEAQWDTFCFISSDAILLPDSKSGRLNLYSFDENEHSIRCNAALALPKAVNDQPIAHICCRTDPPEPSNRPRPGMHNKPFQTDAASTVVVITLDYIIAPPQNVNVGNWVFDVAHTEVFAIHRATLRSFVERAKIRRQTPERNGNTLENTDEMFEWPIVPSDPNNPVSPVSRTFDTPLFVPSKAWLPHSRWGLGPPPPRWVCYTHGSRYVSMHDRIFGLGAKVGIRIYDFNITPANRAECVCVALESGKLEEQGSPSESSDGKLSPVKALSRRISLNGVARGEQENSIHHSPNADEPQLEFEEIPNFDCAIRSIVTVTSPSVINNPHVFAEPIESGLPYRVIETDAVFDWDSVMIDDERIIGLREEVTETGGLDSFDVLAF